MGRPGVRPGLSVPGSPAGIGPGRAWPVTIGGKTAFFAVVQNQNMVVIVPSTVKKGKTAVVITNSAGSTTSSLKVT